MKKFNVGYTTRTGEVIFKDTFGNPVEYGEKEARKNARMLFKQNYAGHGTFIRPVK